MATHGLFLLSALFLTPLPLGATPNKAAAPTGIAAPTTGAQVAADAVRPTRAMPLRAVSILHRPGMIRLVQPPQKKAAKVVREAKKKAPAPVVRRSVGWGAGEQMTYSVKIAGVEAGRVALSVGRPSRKEGVRTLSIRGAGETIPFFSTFHRMKEEIVTLINLSGVLPVRSTSRREAPKKNRMLATSFEPKTLLHKIERPGRKEYQRRRIIVGQRFDPISTLYALRSVPLPKGAKLSMLMLSGTTLYRLELEVQGKERIYTTLGPKNTHRVGGVALRITDQGKVIKSRAPRKVRMWLSADRRRIPLRLVGDTKLGLVEAIISSYRPPRWGLTVGKPLI